MNNQYVERAKKKILNPKILSIIAARRASQLARGARPMVKCDSENPVDVALLEIAEDKLFYSVEPTAGVLEGNKKETSAATDK